MCSTGAGPAPARPSRHLSRDEVAEFHRISRMVREVSQRPAVERMSPALVASHESQYETVAWVVPRTAASVLARLR